MRASPRSSARSASSVDRDRSIVMPNRKTREEGPDPTEMAVALAAVALGLFVFAGSSSISLGAGYDHIGPRFFPSR